MFWKSIKIQEVALWKPLKPKFQNVLMSNKFVMKDCSGTIGNCLLSCLETAFQSDGIKIEKKYVYKNLIKNIKALDEFEFENVMDAYKLTEKEGFERFWETKYTKKKKDLVRVVKKEDMFFEGNDIGTLYLLSVCFKIEFIIFNEMYKSMKIGDHKSFVYLYYDSKAGKYSILGLKYYDGDDGIVTIALFNKDSLPMEIKFLTNMEAYIIEQTKRIFLNSIENNEEFDKGKLVKRVDNNIFINLTDRDREELGQVLIKWFGDINKNK